MDLNSLALQIPQQIDDKASINGDAPSNGGITIFPQRGFSSEPFELRKVSKVQVTS